MSLFLAWGDFHARSRFARSTIPEEKWGTTRSLGIEGMSMAMTWVALAARPTPLNASVTSVFVNAVGKGATPRGVVATANSELSAWARGSACRAGTGRCFGNGL